MLANDESQVEHSNGFFPPSRPLFEPAEAIERPIKKLNRMFGTVSMEVFYPTPGLVNAATVAVFIAARAQAPVGARFVVVNFVILLLVK